MKEVESNNGKASDSPNVSNNNNVSSIYSKYYDGTTDYDHDNNNDASGIAMLQPCYSHDLEMFKDVLGMS